ncbi:MAG: hypothetical protein ACF8PN_11435 [Phycisphaerales bacterium]
MWSDAPDSHEPLSETGRRRREAMLGELQVELGRMRAFRRRRRAATHAAFAVVIAGSAMAAWTTMNRASNTPTPDRIALPASPELFPSNHEDATTATSALSVRVKFVTTDRDASSRFAVKRAQRPIIQRIDDRELVETLAEINRPAGLVRTANRAWVTADITGVDRDLEEGSDAGPQRSWRRWLTLFASLG